jgi:hypothetical protein
MNWLIVFISIAAADKAAVSVSEGTVTTGQAVQAPECIPIGLKKKGDIIRKEDVPASVGDNELMARLIFAETKAANCSSNMDARISERITHVILNRVRAFEAKQMDQPVRRTVFGAKQFASSLHYYSKSHWKAFTCPGEVDPALYEKVTATLARVQNGETSGADYSKATHYYLHRHFGSYKDHPWGRKAKVVADDECLGVYDLDKGFLDARF